MSPGEVHTHSHASKKKNKIHIGLILFPGQAEEVFSNMAGDFMRPVVDVVDQLLSAGVNVTIYNGQLDLIVDTMGARRRPREQGLPRARSQT